MSKFQKIFFVGLVVYLVISLGLPILAAEKEEIITGQCKIGGETTEVKLIKSALWENTNPCCRAAGDCQLRDLLQIFVNIAHIIYKYIAVTALIVWVWAGFGLVSSRGNPQAIAANKKLIVGTLLALCIVLIAYLLVYVILAMFTTPLGTTPGPSKYLR